MSSGNPEYLSFTCPQCQKRLKAPPALAGKKISCPKCNAGIKVPGAVESGSDDDDWLSLDEPPKKPRPTAPSQPVSPETPLNSAPSLVPSFSSQPRARSVFDDELPELAPEEWDQPKIAASQAPIKPIKASPAPSAEIDPDEIQLEPLAPVADPTQVSSAARPKNSLASPTLPTPKLTGSLEQLSLDQEALAVHLQTSLEEEFRFPCKVCGTILYAKESRVGSRTRCPDCFSEFSVPTPPIKKKVKQLKLNEADAHVTFAPIDSKTVRGDSIGAIKTKELLDKAAIEVDRESEEFDSVTSSFDSKRWASLTFGFLRDPLVIFAAVVLGIFSAGWLGAIEAIGTVIKLDANLAIFLKLAIFTAFSIPILGSICLFSLHIVPMAANRLTRMEDWPLSKIGESIGECVMVLVALIASSIPGSILAAAMNAAGAHPGIAIAFVMISVWGFFPLLILSMVENGSLFEPYSKSIIKSLASHKDAWGSMYMQIAFAAFILYSLILISLSRDLVGDVILGLFLPFLCFFMANQLGVLAGRISEVTEMGFEGDFSDD